MKILYICNRFYPALGGVETHVFNIAKRFIDKNNSVDVVCSDMVAINSSERFKNKSGEIVGIHFKKFWSLRILGIDATTFMPYLPLFLFLNVKKYDIIHAHSYGYFSSWAPILICKLLNKKIIYTAHYADETVLPKIVKRLFDFLIAGWSFRMATRVIALTSVEKDILIRKFRVRPQNIVVIPNGINLSEYSKHSFSSEEREKILSRNGIKNKNKNIITVSRIAKNKGHIYLLMAFKDILDCNLIIIGKDWGEKEHLMNFVKEKKINNVFFLENINDVEKNNLLKLSDVFILPSLGGESFGIVLLEAMANGLPVIASKVGGIKDLIHEGKNGYLIEPGNVQQIEEKVDAVLFNKNIESMKRYCRDFSSQYDWDKVYEKISNLYQNILRV
jgi:glycosyltransferase involved in cell wall biosynthesis